jgi:hypothetical protein
MPRATNPWEAELLRLGRRTFLRRAATTGSVLALGGFGLDRPRPAPVAHHDGESGPPAGDRRPARPRIVHRSNK